MKRHISAPILFLILATAFFNVPGGAGTAHAIPAFTRANNVECSTCHTIFPELNEYGEAFLKNGYVYFGKGKKRTAELPKTSPVVAEKRPAAPPSAAVVVKGDGDAELLKKLKAGVMVSADAPVPSAAPEQSAGGDGNDSGEGVALKSEGITLSGVPEHLPVSFTANLHGSYNKNAINEFDFSTRSLKLNLGGNFKEKAGFFGTYLVYTENTAGIANTSQTPANGVSDIGELFFMWRHAFDTSFNVKVGRFQPKLGLWKANNKLTVTNPYATYSYRVGSSWFNAEQPQDALEANMIFANRLFMAGGVVNRKNQNTKEWYVHTSVKFGGADYLANEPEIDLGKEESIFDFLTVTVGGYGYVGTNGDPNTVPGKVPRQNEYYRAGADIDLLYKQFRLKLSGVLGNDNNADLTYSLPEVKSQVAVIEGQYAILKNLIGSLRFEYTDDGVGIYRSYIPAFAYAPLENVKVVIEYKQKDGIAYLASGTSYLEERIGTLGVTFGF